MSLLTTLRKDKMQALKDKDTVKNGICSLLISAIALAEKEAGFMNIPDGVEDEGLPFN